MFSHTASTGVITYVSDGVETVFGVSKDAALGKPWQTLIELSGHEKEKAAARIQEMRGMGRLNNNGLN